MNIAIDKQGAGLGQRLLTQVGDLNLALSKQGQTLDQLIKKQAGDHDDAVKKQSAEAASSLAKFEQQ